METKEKEIEQKVSRNKKMGRGKEDQTCINNYLGEHRGPINFGTFTWDMIEKPDTTGTQLVEINQ